MTKRPPVIKGILFDKDGTLIDFDRTWGPAAWEVMRALADGDRRKFERLTAVSLYDEETRSFSPDSPLVGGSSAEYGPLWADALGRPADAALYAEMDELFRFWGLESLAPICEPAALLTRLADDGYRLGIATNDAEGSAAAQADAMGLTPLLDYLAGYDSGFGSKPGPGMVTAFAERCDLRPGEVVMIGDSIHDLAAARAAGAVALGVLTGPLGAEARTTILPYADDVIPSIAELPEWLARRHGASAERVEEETI